MNVHDSEKVVGTLVARRLPPGPDRRRGRPGSLQHLLDPRQGRAESLQPPRRLQEIQKARQEVRRARLRRAAGRRKDFRARAVRFAGLRIGVVPQSAADAGANRSRELARHRTRRPRDRRVLRNRIHRPHQSASRIHHHHRRLRQVLRLLRRALTRAARSAAALRSRCSPKPARWPISATPKFSCSART